MAQEAAQAELEARMLPRYVTERLPIVSRMREEVRLFAMMEGQPDQVCVKSEG